MKLFTAAPRPARNQNDCENYNGHCNLDGSQAATSCLAYAYATWVGLKVELLRRRIIRDGIGRRLRENGRVVRMAAHAKG